MTDLLNKIKGVHPDVAKVLQDAGLRSDSDIRSLTGAELHQLFPEKKDLKLRRTIFEMIHKQEPVGQLLREMKNVIPNEDFKAVLTGNRVLVDYLCIMKDMHTQVKHIQSFQEGHIRFLEENIQNQPDPESATNLKEPLGDPPQEAHGHSPDLLEEIRNRDRDAAVVLREADLCSDSDIRSLTREELLELFPGTKNFKLRRRIFEMIQNQKPVKQPPPTRVNNGIPSRGEIMTDLLNKIKGVHPDVAKVLQAALTGNGVLVDYLCIMKDMQTHVKHIQSFQEAHIRFLEENIQNQPEPESATILKETLGDPPQEAHGHSSDLLEEIGNRDRDAADVLREADLCSDSDIRSLTQEELHQLFPGLKNFKLRRRIFEIIQNQKPVKPLPPTGVNNGIPSREERSKVANKWKGTLVYQMVVTGTTFDAHVQLMEKVKNEVKDQFDLVQSNDYDVTIVFCPIVSRMGPYVESAMRDVKGDKPVILVLMHHAYEAKFIPNVQQGANVQLQVNVFFHETKHGLLHCGENGAVVCEITKYLKEIPITNAQVVAAGHSGKS
ncbi:hypothetical protein OYC64_005262 [Pagothenia borchgrevinki]|uniref:Uncharacterized protein n=1 Tax=Pagothenia borchgrevinki TaxID=8213 RepID=A0ABD2GEZ2_PAGBO